MLQAAPSLCSPISAQPRQMKEIYKIKISLQSQRVLNQN